MLLSLQSAPELARLLGEDLDNETALFEQHSKTGTANRGPGFSVQGGKGGGSHAVSPDNPALAAEEELTEEDELVWLRKAAQCCMHHDSVATALPLVAADVYTQALLLHNILE